MSRYRSYGQLDDQFVVEGDTYFQRMNARLRPTQLQPGEVALSENGRMSEDGTWQPRKGLQTLSGAITIDSAAIRLPYRVAGGQRSNGVVTLTLEDIPSVAFEPGDDLTVVGVNAVTDSPNGTFTIDEVFYSNRQIQYTQAGADESFTTDDESIVTPETSIPTQLDFVLSEDAANEVFGSCVYSDPESTFTDDYIFTATNNVMQILRLRDRAEYKVRYPATESVYSRCHLMQAYNRVYLFRGIDTTLECTPTLTTFPIATAVRVNNTITITTSANHNLVQDQFITLVGLGNYAIGGNPNGIYQVEANNLAAQSFEVTFATADTGTETYIASGSRVEHFNDFTLVANGQYTLPDHIIDLAVISGTGNFVGGVNTNPEGQDGQITINEPSHGLEVSQTLTIVDAGSPIDLYIGKEVKVSQVIDANHFTIPLSVGAITFGDNVILKLAKKNPISFLRHMPAAPFAIHSQRRLWMPYFYEEDYDVTPFSWTARAGKDEIIASDILDPDTYDVIGGQFKVTGGSNDFVVGLKAFTEDRILVLCRRSIQQLSGASGSLQDVRIDNVTNDLGCASRSSIVQVGNQLLFLSDKGVYALEFLDAYNLRGNEIPLSDPIQPYIDRINQRFINRSVAAYFDNRYWLAVPLDGSSENNYLLVYNFINQGWESVDRVDSLQFNIRDILVAREGEENRLYIYTSEGGVHKVDGFDGGDQISVTAGVSVSETIPVQSRLITRQYDCDTLDRKVFSRSEVHLKSQPDSTSDANIVYETTDPDRSQSAQAVSSLIGSVLPQGEDASIRSRIRLRGHGCSVNISPTQGRPYVRAVKVEGRITDRSTTSTT
jgi:hypothetical protein